MNGSVGLGGTATVAIGAAGATGKYRAAAIHNTAGPTLFGVATAGASKLTSDETVFITIGAASLPASGTLLVDLYFSQT